jgi:hypothetical protein
MRAWNDLLHTKQRRVLAEQMRILRGHDLLARRSSVEAEAWSNELLRAPVFRHLKSDKTF